MITANSIEGLWTVVKQELDGVPLSDELVQNMYPLLILDEKWIEGTSGVFGSIWFFNSPTPTAVTACIDVMRQLVAGINVPRHPDFHVMACGGLLLGNSNNHVTADFIQYYGAATLTQLAILRFDESILEICMASTGEPRPAAFNMAPQGCAITSYVRAKNIISGSRYGDFRPA